MISRHHWQLDSHPLCKEQPGGLAALLQPEGTVSFLPSNDAPGWSSAVSCRVITYHVKYLKATLSLVREPLTVAPIELLPGGPNLIQSLEWTSMSLESLPLCQELSQEVENYFPLSSHTNP